MEKKHRILIIDDSRDTVEGLSCFLGQKHDVIKAYNGFDGLQALENSEKKIDLVITDLLMPELSGAGVISIVKKKYPGTPVIAITGWVGNTVLLAHQTKADQVLNKPFDLECLEAHVVKLLLNNPHSN